MGGGISGGGGKGGKGGYFKGTKGGSSEKNTTVHEGRQGKHILGHNNYRPGGSIFNGTVQEAQALIDKFTGKGKMINDRRERVDFGKVIGKYFDTDTRKYYDTTVGTIRYSKDGTHIVPAKPNNWEEIK